MFGAGVPFIQHSVQQVTAGATDWLAVAVLAVFAVAMAIVAFFVLRKVNRETPAATAPTLDTVHTAKLPKAA